MAILLDSRSAAAAPVMADGSLLRLGDRIASRRFDDLTRHAIMREVVCYWRVVYLLMILLHLPMLLSAMMVGLEEGMLSRLSNKCQLPEEPLTHNY